MLKKLGEVFYVNVLANTNVVFWSHPQRLPLRQSYWKDSEIMKNIWNEIRANNKAQIGIPDE